MHSPATGNNVHWLKHMSSNRIRAKCYENRGKQFCVNGIGTFVWIACKSAHYSKLNDIPYDMMRIELKKLDSLVVSFMFVSLKIHSNDAIYLFGGFSINKPPRACVCSVQCASIYFCTPYVCVWMWYKSTVCTLQPPFNDLNWREFRFVARKKLIKCHKIEI